MRHASESDLPEIVAIYNSTVPTRQSTADTQEVSAEVSIYVAQQYRGRGLGRQLLMEAMAMTPALGVKTLVGFVFAHNEPSIRLLRSCGFEEWGRLPDIAEMDGKEYSLCIFGKRINP